MKRIFLLTFLFVASISGFAQKANVSKAQNKALSVDAPDFNGAKDAIDEALSNPETSGQTKTLYVAGLVYEKAAEAESLKGDAADYIQLGEDALKAYSYYLEAYKLDNLPDAKGKIKPKYTNKIRTSLISIYRHYYLVNYGIKQYEVKEYANAVNALEVHTSIAHLPVVQSSKDAIAIDSAYYEIILNAGMIAWSGMESDSSLTQKAINLYSSLKGKNYKENGIYQSLAQIYQSSNDSANFLAVLEEGVVKFPQEFYFLGNLINYYVFSGQTDKATMYLNRAIENDPNNAQLFNVKGGMLELQGDVAGAMENFDKALALDPNNADILINKGRLIYNTAVKHESDAWDQKDDALQTKMLNDAKEEFKRAIPYFEKALEIKGDDFEVMKNLRGLYYKFKDADSIYDTKYNEINNRIQGL